ncbi:MAG: exo-alpha-sialidase, partial [Acidobacteriota bacterium]
PSFGFAVAVDPEDADIAWFVPAVRDEHRLPADQRLVVHRTRDGGQTFETIAEGLPDPSFDLIFRHALAVDSGGDRLVMGSTTGNLWTSADAGSTWTLRSGHLPTVYQLLWL